MSAENYYREFSIFDIYLVIKKRLVVLILIPLFCGLLAYAYATLIATPMYTSSASLLITKGIESENDSTATWNNNVYSEVLAVQQLADVYTQILTSENMMKTVKQELNTDVSVAQLMGSVSVVGVNDSGLRVSVTMVDPVLAYKVATKIVEHANSEVAETFGIGAVVELSSPVVPTAPSSPRTKMMTASAIGLSFIALLIVLILISYFDDRIKDESEFEQMFGLPVLGMIPKYEVEK